jgi:hypothetical protein
MRVITLSVPDATARLADLKQELSKAIDWKQRLEDQLSDLLTHLHEKLPKRGRSHEQRLLAEELSAAIAEIKQGVDVREGVSEHIDIERFAGKPGLDEITERIPRLRKDIRTLKRHLTQWPSEEATRPYRFKGSTGLTFFDGLRELEPGEIVNLTRAQAANLRDRFEEVQEDQVQNAS